jgi:hypothetical protein
VDLRVWREKWAHGNGIPWEWVQGRENIKCCNTPRRVRDGCLHVFVSLWRLCEGFE